MSGLSDIARWALGGGAGGNAPRNNRDEEDEDEDDEDDDDHDDDDEMEEDDNNDDGNANTLGTASGELPPVPVTAEELRNQRLARLGALGASATAASTSTTVDSATPMDIDTKDKSTKKVATAAAMTPVAKKAAAAASHSNDKVPAITAGTASSLEKNRLIKKAKSEDFSPGDPNKKLQRKKELLLTKCLQVQLVGSSNSSNGAGMDATTAATLVDTGSTEISVATIAEILASRLSMEPSSLSNNSTGASAAAASPQLVIAYLGAAYNRTNEELRSLHNVKKPTSDHDVLVELVSEIQKQTVSYTATCLMEPSVFANMAKNIEQQLCYGLLQSGSTQDKHLNLTSGGISNSFYGKVMDELGEQSMDCLKKTVTAVVKTICALLAKSDTILDSIPMDNNNSMIVMNHTMVVNTLTSICAHKSAAAAMVDLDTFLLPAAGTPDAVALIRPPMPTGMNPLQQLLGNADAHRPYKARSGPALDKSTLLGLLLRAGIPRSMPNAAFPYQQVFRQSPSTVDSISRTQRQQLAAHQEACFQFLKMLLKNGGEAARVQVLAWFTDALLVNIGATAMRVDHSKVSSTSLLLNVMVVLLKLCEPFTDEKANKQHLIDAGFVATPTAHGGVFGTTGDDAVPRLGGTSTSDDTSTATTYNPKNAFIPHVFFFCARSLHLSIVPFLQLHEHLLRNVSYHHHEITNAGRDVQHDPHLQSMISRQRSDEVSLFQDEMIDALLKFCNFMAQVLHDMDDATVAKMPEEFVSDPCEILLAIAMQKPQLLAGHDFRHMFKLAVKLLSPTYAAIVRNYNLRAQLGDVLHDIFLPRSPNSRREVPASVAIDPLAGGQTFLLSDASAQVTLAPSLLLLYGEVEHTGHYEKMSHRAKIASLIKYLWDSAQHRPAFRRITQNRESFIIFANGIMNETNTLIATIMQKLPEIREAQDRMKNAAEWGRLSEEEQKQVTERLEENERSVKSALPLCNKTIQMFGYLNSDPEVRTLFLLDELCSRLVIMLIHVLTKLVGTKGLELKVDNPEELEFRPKEMLRDLCAIFALFASSDVFQNECAKAECDPSLLNQAVNTCKKLNLLEGESLVAFAALPKAVEAAASRVADEESLLAGAPEEFLDEIMSTFMKDPIILPSGHIVDRSTITQHLLNDPMDPFNREPLTVDQLRPATELKARMDAWLEEKRAAAAKPMDV